MARWAAVLREQLVTVAEGRFCEFVAGATAGSQQANADELPVVLTGR